MPLASAQNHELFSSGDPESIFTDLKEIGHGSFGNVYFARDTVNNDIVAIKKMAYSGKNSQEKFMDIQKEIEFLKKCHHRNCIQFKGCFLKGMTVWLSMEYCLGSAADIIEVHKEPLAECEIGAMIKDTLCALEYIHSNEMIHRDVKAGNILIAASGRVKLADFGSASLRSPANSFVGTPYWMAPEVILAMDEGTYDDRVDIWSLGITCIELCEGKPPLFNMNAMAALYHIAQNESPRLGENERMPNMYWTRVFKDFVARCLMKEAHDRPRASELLRHPWIAEVRPDGILSELVARTKDAVRRLDNKSYKAAKQIFMLNNHSQKGTEDDVDDNDTSSTGSTGSLPDPDSMEYDSDNGEESDNETERRNSVVEVGSSSEQNQDEDEAGEISFSQITCDIDIKRENFRPNAHEGFSTIKANATLSKQLMANNPEHEIKNQMMIYKQMRQHNVKQLKQLEQRHKSAVEELRRNLERDMETLKASNERELEKFKRRTEEERLQNERDEAHHEKKFIKQLNEKYDDTSKKRSNEVKRVYTQKKELLKRELSETPKQTRKTSFDVSKERLRRDLTENEQRFLETVQKENEIELKNYRLNALKQKHTLENQSLQEELNLKQVHKDSIAHQKRKHHQDMYNLQKHHLVEIQQLRQKQLEEQLKAEWENQMEYTQRIQKELRRKHLLQSKQLPRALRKKKAQIQKQYEATCKIIESQYKELLKDYLKNTAKELHKDIIRKIKDDKMRKMINLDQQYTSLIAEQLEREQLSLDGAQQQEQEELRIKLQNEQDLVQAYQTKLQQRLQESIKRENELFETESQKKLNQLHGELVETDQWFTTERAEAESRERARQRKERTDFQAMDHTLHRNDNFMVRTWGRRSSPWPSLGRFS